MSTEVVVTSDELQILLNHLGSRVKVDYPCTKLQLFNAEFDADMYDMDLFFGPEDFNEKARSYLWSSEQPSYNDLLQCFLASGLINYLNIDEIREKVDMFRNLGRKVVFCPDTNMFYNNFLSSTGLLKPDELVFVDLSHREISASINYKLSSVDVAEIKADIKYQPALYNELVNCKSKTSRKASNLALVEYLEYCDRVSNIIEAVKSSPDKEHNDILFVEAVENYLKRSLTYPVILTCDRMMLDICRARGVECLHLELPQVIHPMSAKPIQLVKLFSTISGVLGFIKVENMIIYGEFRKKNNIDEHKIMFLDGKPHISFERDLEICRNLINLNISSW